MVSDAVVSQNLDDASRIGKSLPPPTSERPTPPQAIFRQSKEES
jgi:hypothetical protein